MSVAFTKESDIEAHAAEVPDRPVSHHPNLVTAAGLARIEAELARARAELSAARAQGDAQTDRTAMARAARDVRYWTARRASAQLMEREQDSEIVQFGDRIVIERDDGRRQTWRIVGEDEADPADGSVSWVSPLAQALLGKKVGDEAVVAGSGVELVSIS